MTDVTTRRLTPGLVLRLAATATLVSLILWWVGPRSLLDAVLGARPVPLLTAILLVPFGLAFTVLAWKTVLRTIDPGTGWADCIRGVFVGASTGLITPARVGEIAPRILYGNPHHRARRAAGFLLESALRFSAQFLMAGGAWLVTAPLLFPEASGGVLGIGLGFIALGIAILGVSIRPKRALSLLTRLPIVRNYAKDVASMPIVGGVSVLAILGVTILRYLVATAQFALILASMGVGIHVAPAMLVLFGKGIIPNPFITDLGVREGLSAFVFERLGQDPAAAVAASLFIYVLNLVLPAAIGVLMARKPVAGSPAAGSSSERA